MLKEEFERLVGYEVSDSEYRVIECCYMAAGDDVQKEEFCKEWKERLGSSKMLMAICDRLTDERNQALLNASVAEECLEKIQAELSERGLKWDNENEEVVEMESWERIQTLDDALMATGMTLPEGLDDMPDDVQAYLRLRVICAAVNGLSKDSLDEFPKFEKGERRYVPWFWFYESKEKAMENGWEESDIFELPAVVGGANRGDTCGVSVLFSNGVASASYTAFGGALVLRDRDRAIYCGKQFMAEWLSFYLRKDVGMVKM